MALGYLLASDGATSATSLCRLTFVRMTVWSLPQEMRTVFFMIRQSTEVGTCWSTDRLLSVRFSFT